MIETIVGLIGGWRAVAFAALLALAASYGAIEHARATKAESTIVGMQRDAAQSFAAAVADARLTEQKTAIAAANAAAQYEKGKADAQAAADRVVADLRSEQLRLRSRWQCPAAPAVPAIAAATAEPDAGAVDRDASASRIVRAAAECDAQVKGLQALILADRGGAP